MRAMKAKSVRKTSQSKRKTCNTPAAKTAIQGGTKLKGSNPPDTYRSPIVPPRKCFVMMPFGPITDRYYSEVYAPAIKSAGLEPVRGDEIFRPGCVVDQIRDQIDSASILLADLTGKNANVFYELGLAHRASKQVVLTAASIDDVPFDLRHMRVSTYDTRMPNWCRALSKSVTAHLRSALAGDVTKAHSLP
jgi:hypothetical protein